MLKLAGNWLTAQKGILLVFLAGFLFGQMVSVDTSNFFPQMELEGQSTMEDDTIAFSSTSTSTADGAINKDGKTDELEGQSTVEGGTSSYSTSTTARIMEEESKVNTNIGKSDSHKPLNVIIFYPDDWYGRDLQDVNPLLRTPTFSQLAKEGIRFTHNAVVTSICWISRGTLFTGQYAVTHKSQYLYRPSFANFGQWQFTWPYQLQKYADYWVGHVGKWQYNDSGNYKKRIFNFSSYFEGWTVRGEGENREYIADLARDEAIRFLRERPKDKPFATTVAFYPPKGVAIPSDTKPKYHNLYQNITFPEAYDRAMAYQRLPPFLQNNGTMARSRYLWRFETDSTFQDTMTAQYATLTHLDDMVGQVLQELKDQGEYDNTMVIVTADNGEFHGAHALADKW